MYIRFMNLNVSISNYILTKSRVSCNSGPKYRIRYDDIHIERIIIAKNSGQYLLTFFFSY